jgi:tRNA (cytidine56-2'-O)-methyltransferase
MICILRLGHRISRDHRISTHCGLVARALGAKRIFYTGDRDPKMEESIRSAVKNWGGPFEIEYTDSWKKAITSHKRKGFSIVHLTMYGMPIEKHIFKIKNKRNILVIIGSEKVPSEVYHIADHNIAVTSQPHSEVAALAIFLYSLNGRKTLETGFKKAKLKIVPQKCGKLVLKQ